MFKLTWESGDFGTQMLINVIGKCEREFAFDEHMYDNDNDGDEKENKDVDKDELIEKHNYKKRQHVHSGYLGHTIGPGSPNPVTIPTELSNRLPANFSRGYWKFIGHCDCRGNDLKNF